MIARLYTPAPQLTQGRAARQELDGLREAELAGRQIGTTKRGIGPAYASKATRNGLRVGDLRDMATFADKLRVLARDGAQRFEGFAYDVEARHRPAVNTCNLCFSLL